MDNREIADQAASLRKKKDGETDMRIDKTMEKHTNHLLIELYHHTPAIGCSRIIYAFEALNVSCVQ